LVRLVEEAIDGCWIGHRARTNPVGEMSGIGTVYSPPKQDDSPVETKRKHVETVIDIGARKGVSPSRCLTLFHELH
jgi:adenylylsulfate kinase-like enzyme